MTTTQQQPPPLTTTSSISIDQSEKTFEYTVQFVTQRRQMFDQLVWQIPALTLTGESFLLTIALGAGVSNIARIIASGLGIIVAICCVQSLDRLKVSEWYDAHALRIMLQKDNQDPIPAVLGQDYRKELSKYYQKTWQSGFYHPNKDQFFQFSSLLSWIVCFWILILINIIILILSSIQYNIGNNEYFT